MKSYFRGLLGRVSNTSLKIAPDVVPDVGLDVILRNALAVMVENAI